MTSHISLHDNDVHDGELLALSRVDEPAPGAIRLIAPSPRGARHRQRRVGGLALGFLPGTAGVIAVAVACGRVGLDGRFRVRRSANADRR